MLSPELQQLKTEIEGYARDYGLDFFETIFEIVDAKQVSEIAAYGGFPTRYPHWRFGMEFDKLDKGYTYGGQRIYEMVINNNPCYAYLMASNPIFDQKTVMAHVFAHNDFFKNNLWFSKTNRKMMDEMANHSARIRRYQDRFGVDEVETFLDIALSLENLIDPHAPFIEREAKPMSEEDERAELDVPMLKAKKYMERYINPKEYVDEQKLRLAEKKAAREKRFPEEPVRDVLQFLIAHAPLKEWQQDLLSIVREEAYYFAPQWMTKIMNEGWATYWHSKIMTQKALADSEIINYADHYAGVVATSKGSLNPYKVGVELFRHIEERWDMGRFGRDYDECDNMAEKHSWDKKLMLGREKIFLVRKLHNDVTFIDEFLTPEFCIEHKLFTYGYNPKRDQWEIVSRQFEDIKQKLLQNLTNAGNPFISVLDANFENRGELLLRHQHEGVDLNIAHATETLSNLYRVWSRPTAILTMLQDRPVMIRFDGTEHAVLELERDADQEAPPTPEVPDPDTP